MLTFTSISQLNECLAAHKQAGRSIGLVPTMGALHEGHLSLIRAAKKDNDVVICSIFVNPKQFNRGSDLDTYPRTPEQDRIMLESVDCDLVFIPTVEEIYPEEPKVDFDFGILDEVLEGAFRPGHFKGVALVVKRFFDLVQPDRAYFGMKDFQQLAVIRAMVKQKHMNVEIIGCPTVREDDGLAMSSRNLLLSSEQREQAAMLYRLLSETRSGIGRSGVAELEATARQQIQSNPHFKLDYFEIVDADTFEPATDRENERTVVACVAAYMGDVRLIDNMILNA